MLEVVLTAKGDDKIKTKVVVWQKGDKIPAAYRKQAEYQGFDFAKGKVVELWDKDERVIVYSVGEKPDNADMQEAGKELYAKLEKTERAMLSARDDEAALTVTYGILQGSYSFDKYKTTKKPEEFPALEQLVVKVKNEKKAAEAYKDYVALYTGIRYARDLCNEPANCLTPEIFSRDIKRLEYLGLDVEILDKDNLSLKGLGLIEAVGKGSVNAPKMVIVSWKGNRKTKEYDLGLVGKGVCFDAGGLSLKTTQGMLEMKQDMSGAAAVVAVMKTAALQRCKKNLLAIVALVENMPDGRACKVGDVYASYSGKTVEVNNTDAEGRLIVADALSYMQRNYTVKKLVDVTTLGSLNGVLGKVYGGLFANDDKWAAELIAAGKACGEELWRMPLNEKYAAALKSTLADVRNVAPEAKASITSAAFLEGFIEKGAVWAHIDMSNMRMDGKGLAAGFGVKLLNELIRNL
ncbi:MAG: leucyl aminopeptidase family protein [Alphaproteobacteria bacterium]|nr:leucyl aminopeptidase family protein [Alphaproteobacteria bacterium]